MKSNRWPIVVVTTRGYKTTQPFLESDAIVDASGKVLDRGDDPKHVAYRIECIARLEARQKVAG
jgi:hypothetical protein